MDVVSTDHVESTLLATMSLLVHFPAGGWSDDRNAGWGCFLRCLVNSEFEFFEFEWASSEFVGDFQVVFGFGTILSAVDQKTKCSHGHTIRHGNQLALGSTA